MKRDTAFIRAALAPLNPAPLSRGLDAASGVTLEQILSHRRAGDSSRRPATIRKAAVASAFMAVAVVAGAVGLRLLGNGASPAFAATPPPLTYQGAGSERPDELMHRMADAIEVPSSPAAAGQFDYLRAESWYLNTRVDGDQVDSLVLPVIREEWRAPDGSGLVRTKTGVPTFSAPGGREAWADQGYPYRKPRVEEKEHPPGSLRLLYGEAELSSEQVVLEQQMAVGQQAANGPPDRLDSITDLYRTRVVDPARMPDLLRYLAATPDLVFRGEATDRAGRNGLAFSVDSDSSGLPTRHTLIFDEGTGRLLADEKLLTSDAGKLNVKIPAVISYTNYLASDRVAEIGGYTKGG